MKKILLWVLAAAMMLSLAACGKSEAAKAVDDQIAAIGEVTLESEGAISEAEAAVDALADEDREQLDNVDQLEQARADYEALVLAGKVSEVEDAIAAIGTVTMESADAITDARSLYDGVRLPFQRPHSRLCCQCNIQNYTLFFHCFRRIPKYLPYQRFFYTKSLKYRQTRNSTNTGQYFLQL